ncbi:MAG: hexose kinase [Spirochaetales bacterium]|nr:hexose kinase [Spirochaetales bacterium]
MPRMSAMILVAGHNSDWKKIYRIRRMQVGEVNRLEELHYVAAGKGANTARALTCMGERVLLVGYAGGVNGSRFLDALREEGIPHDFQRIREETRTCVTILEAERHATELIEPSPTVSLAEARGCERRLLRRLPGARVLVLSGTSVEGSPADCYRRYVEAARRRGVPVVLDSYRDHGRLALEASPAVLKINRRELESLVGRALPETADRREAYRALRERYGLSWVIITSGAEAIEGYDGKRHYAVTPPRIEALNPIGSGDAATAGIAACFARGETLAEALRLGAAMGSANCLSLRTGHVDPATVRRLLETLAVEES